MLHRLAAVILAVGLGASTPAVAQISLDSLTGGAAAPAEDTADSGATEPEADADALAQATSEFAAAVPDLDDWRALADRVEEELNDGETTNAMLSAARDDIFAWRQRFLDLTSLNAGRIGTVQAQIDALTPTAPDATVSPAIAARLDELNAQLDALLAPGLLASEAYARANGLISEIDSELRQADTNRLWSRDASPLLPSSWALGADAIDVALNRVMRRYETRMSGGGTSGLWANLPAGIIALLAALVLLVRSPRWLLLAQTKVENSEARGRAIWALLLSVLQIGLPVLGMSLLFVALRQFGILPRSGTSVTSAVYTAGVLIIVTRWLNVQLFPKGTFNGPLGYPADVRRKVRRTGVAVGVMLAALLIVAALLLDANVASVPRSVVILPVIMLASLFLWRLGALLRHSPMADSGETGTGRVRHVVGLIYMIVAIATPVLSALGYAQAGRALFAPAVMTLAVLGGFIVLQQAITRIYAPDDSESSSLIPILVGMVLFIVLMPVTALVWGASVADLIEVWTRFRAGFQIGETVISPTDFLTFAIIFAVGFILTRFVQRSLKGTVLPRTKLDLGGQNAVVSGLGYIGITLSALIAITLAGIDLSSLAIVAGALSVGIGFGLQTIVQNFVSGIILLIERPIAEGDMIEVNGQVGFVRDISVRSTRIETFDRTDVIIPNADLVSGQVTNWTRGNMVGRLILPVGVAYGSDVELVRKLLLEIGNDHPLVIADPEPQALFVAFGASSLDFELRVILRDVNWKMIVTDEMNRGINAKLAEAGIEIPFPQTDVWLREPKKGQSQSETAPPPHPDDPGAMLTADDLDVDADPDMGQPT
ncbi:DUF3772 domain-containing protein [Loktanella sp. SALINAS62]|uniref:DUF3772 domain-containing protein n=1 Tax=Loktanella sp. SALINAS62 TaxID=2706124 RepID=UPI001B8AC6A0|nr:DUF3772 domain-containing protein [Loktanella sp. SALINAS62]MBS1303499.1 DUF3772 domain-containing protein [Loktanella sp. SALINAS62]